MALTAWRTFGGRSSWGEADVESNGTATVLSVSMSVVIGDCFVDDLVEVLTGGFDAEFLEAVVWSSFSATTDERWVEESGSDDEVADAVGEKETDRTMESKRMRGMESLLEADLQRDPARRNQSQAALASKCRKADFGWERKNEEEENCETLMLD